VTARYQPDASRAVPAPGQAALPAVNAAELLRRNGTDPGFRDRVAIRFGTDTWSHADYYAECCRWANLFQTHRRPMRPLHVGVLLDNSPDYLFALGGAGLVGAAVVGLNHTRVGEALARDIGHTDLSLVVTETGHLDALAAIGDQLSFGADHVYVSRRFDDVGTASRTGGLLSSRDLADAIDAVDGNDPGLQPDVMVPWALIFTSGTSAAPKAVICSQKRLLQTGARMTQLLDVGADDVGYVCMPLFHSNAVMVGWMPSLVAGASVGLARKFSASGWLPDVRRFGATWFNYTGKPLSYIVATAEQPDDAENTLRVAFGNEGSPDVIERFGTRFAVQVIDAFGATEGGIAVSRDGAVKAGAMGIAGEGIRIIGDNGEACPIAVLDPEGRLANADACVGEIVNTAGAGPFEGYYNNPDATEKTLRNGWYWSGDLGYLDADRNLFFAGRTADWVRVDGENFPAGPIEVALSSHPDVVIAAVYGVPDESAGDQVMAALVWRPGTGTNFDGEAFARWVDAFPDLGPKWRPRYLRLARELPTTGTNKVVKRTLVHHQVRRDRVGEADELWVRGRGEDVYRPFTAADELGLARAFAANGRDRFWDL